MQTKTATSQYKLTASDLAVLLALVRGSTLAAAGDRLGLDGSTVFRTVQRIEKGLGARLFERSRAGFLASELAQALAAHAEHIEMQIESARSAAQSLPGEVSGTVRISTTDTVLHGLVAPALQSLNAPSLSYELRTGNELANLNRRDTDIAVRATRRPPAHLVGKRVGPIRVAVFTARQGGVSAWNADTAQATPWIAPDDALPEHPSVVWRKKHYPKVLPGYRVDSILTVAELVAQGMGIGLLPLFLGDRRSDLRRLTDEIEECQTDLWLLTHPESRHLRRVSAVFGHLSKGLTLA